LSGAGASTLEYHNLSGNKLILSYSDVYEGVSNKRAYEIKMSGKTLVVHVYSNTSRTDARGNYAGFMFDRSESTPDPEEISIPYMSDIPIVMVNHSFFYSTYSDKSLSGGGSYEKQGCSRYSDSSYWCSYYPVYDINSDNRSLPLNETLYITVSSNVKDVLVKVNNTPSSQRNKLVDKVVYDLWYSGLWGGDGDGGLINETYKDNKAYFEELFSYGLTDLLVIYHNWQRYGYDEKMPAHYPANPVQGTNEEFKDMIITAMEQGYLFALHEDYWFMSNQSPYYNESDIARVHGSSYNYAISADKMIKYAQLEGPKIMSDYKTNSAYLDVNPAWGPEKILHQLDYNSANPLCMSYAQAIKSNKDLFTYIKGQHNGPLTGEGGVGENRFDSYYAGYVDGVERQIDGLENARLIPDFELHSVKPLMINHGMGYYSRYFLNFSSGMDPKELDWDKYRAMEITFGHAGFFSEGLASSYTRRSDGSYRQPISLVLKEYYLLLELQKQYLSGNTTAILYEYNGRMVDLSAALINGIDFNNARIYQAYDNGLKIYVNYDKTSNWTVSASGRQHILPPNGWVAWNANTGFIEYSALINGSRADYVNSSEYTLVDGRGKTIDYGNIKTSNLKILKSDKTIECIGNNCTILQGCSLSACDCDCYTSGQTPEELLLTGCEMNCSKQGVTGCTYNRRCIKITIPSTTTTTTTSSTRTTSSTTTTSSQPVCVMPGNYPPCDGVSLNEVVASINLWSQGKMDLGDVIDLINAWADQIDHPSQ
jgi:hypothetical protein